MTTQQVAAVPIPKVRRTFGECPQGRFVLPDVPVPGGLGLLANSALTMREAQPGARA
jgi:hypothetical protein